MQNDRSKSLLLLHFLIFIWGFTSILGALISLDSLPIVWHRMTFATVMIAVYFWGFSRASFRIHPGVFKWYLTGGVLIAIHWILFFYAIKITTIALTLSILSSASLMTSILEPILYQRPFRRYEIVFGVVVIFGLLLIYGVQKEQLFGIAIALLATLLSVLFSLLNGRLIQHYPAKNIAFYQLLTGAVVLTPFLFFSLDSPAELLPNDGWDVLWLFLLASVCTAYATIASVEVLKHVSPFTMMISLNLEPVYAIVFSLFIFGEKEYMSPQFYVGVLVILLGVIGNGIYKRREQKKSLTQ